MSRWLAHLLSGLFHPLLVPTYLVVVLAWGAPTVLPASEAGRRLAFGIVALTTLIVPAAGTYLLLRAGRVSSIRLPERQERHFPLLLALLGFLTGAFLAWPLSQLLGFLLLLQAVAVGLTWVITRYWLISAHAVAMGGAVGLLGLLAYQLPGLGMGPAAGAALLAGAVAAARLGLRAHTREQVLAGLALGFGVALGAALAAF